jgi:hypothetical protein
VEAIICFLKTQADYRGGVSSFGVLLFAPTTILSPLRTLVRRSRGLKTKMKKNIQKWTYFKTQ